MKVTSDKMCLSCKAFHDFELPSDINVEKFMADLTLTRSHGLEIQKALPYLDNNQRELLISGTCQKAWDEMFGEEE